MIEKVEEIYIGYNEIVDADANWNLFIQNRLKNEFLFIKKK